MDPKIQDFAFRSWIKLQRGLNLTAREEAALRESRGGQMKFALTLPERRAMTTQDLTAGGALVMATDVVGSVELAMQRASAMLSVCTLIRTEAGTELAYPCADDTSNEGRWIAENAAATDTAEPTFGSLTLGANTVTSDEVVVSGVLFEDSAPDLAAAVGTMLGQRVGRAVNLACTTGAVPGRPTGLLADVGGAGVGKTATAVSDVTFDEILDLVGSVDEEYAESPGSGFMMSLSTWIYLLKKVGAGSGNHHPASVISARPRTLFGWRVTLNRHFPSLAASAKTIAFGDFSKYVIRQVKEFRIRRTEERRAEKDQLGFLGFSRVDGGLLTPKAGAEPVKVIQQAAA